MKMKKIMVLALAFILGLSVTAAWGLQYPDMTWVWPEKDGVNPTWVDTIGLGFDTKGADFNLATRHLFIYSDWGPAEDDANIKTADLFLDLDCSKDNVFEYAIGLDTKIPPGNPNGVERLGNVYANPSFITATDIFSPPSLSFAYGGYYNIYNSVDPPALPPPTDSLPVPVLATSAQTGSITVVWGSGGSIATYMVDIDLSSFIPAYGIDFCFLWGTATCANDVFEDHVVPLPPSVFLLAPGLLALGFFRRRKTDQ
jgi:hypothetical protein